VLSCISRGRPERLPTPWIAGQIAQLDRVDGDIDTLMTRIAHIRTWTYITHRGDWVDRRGRLAGARSRYRGSVVGRAARKHHAALCRSPLGVSGACLSGDEELLASVDKKGEVRVEGSYVGRLDGFRFIPDASDGAESRMLATAANRVLRGEIAVRARQLAADDDAGFAIDPVGNVTWRGGLVGRLSPAKALSRRGSRCWLGIFSKAGRASACASGSRLLSEARSSVA
jgi:ATP-dependent RNA helicase SUPV3L1/SUV3